MFTESAGNLEKQGLKNIHRNQERQDSCRQVKDKSLNHQPLPRMISQLSMHLSIFPSRLSAPDDRDLDPISAFWLPEVRAQDPLAPHVRGREAYRPRGADIGSLSILLLAREVLPVGNGQQFSQVFYPCR